MCSTSAPDIWTWTVLRHLIYMFICIFLKLLQYTCQICCHSLHIGRTNSRYLCLGPWLAIDDGWCEKKNASTWWNFPWAKTQVTLCLLLCTQWYVFSINIVVLIMFCNSCENKMLGYRMVLYVFIIFIIKLA